MKIHRQMPIETIRNTTSGRDMRVSGDLFLENGYRANRSMDMNSQWMARWSSAKNG